MNHDILFNTAKYQAKKDIKNITITLGYIQCIFEDITSYLISINELRAQEINICCEDISVYKKTLEENYFNFYKSLYIFKFTVEDFLKLNPKRILGVEIGSRVSLRRDHSVFGDFTQYSIKIPRVNNEKFFCLVRMLEEQSVIRRYILKEFSSHKSEYRITVWSDE